MDILTSLRDRLALIEGKMGLSAATIGLTPTPSAAATASTAEDTTLRAAAEGGALIGGPGNDRILGRGGDDRLIGGSGDDFIKGAGGNDTLIGSGGSDRLIGGGGADFINGGGGADSLKGGGGADRLKGGGGADTLIGGGGTDTLIGNGGADILKGGGGEDSLNGGGGDDTLTGGRGGDTLNGGRGEDRLAGDGGDDKLIGGRGADVMFGGGGNDELLGDADTDFLSGEEGDDSLFGGDGEDTLEGGDGDDFLSSGANFDQLFGGEGADTLNGGQDNATLTGGAGADVFVYDRNGGVDTISDFSFSEGDRIDLRDRGIRRASEFDVIERDGGAVISFRGAGEIFAQGVSASDLAADAFIFEAFTPAPSIVTGAGQGAVNVGDGPLTLRLEVEDPDPDERFFIPAFQEGIFGDFEISADGVWTFTVDDEDPETLALAEGIVGIDTFDVSTVDGGIFNISVAVTGRNDAPRLLNDPGDASPFFPNFVTDQFGSFDYSTFFVDFDNGDPLTYDLSFQPAGTTFFPNGDSIGVLSGVVPTESLFLTPPPGQSNLPFKLLATTITVTDEVGASVSVDHEIRVTLRQFPAEIGGDLTATLIAGEEVDEGFLTISDRNDGDDQFESLIVGSPPLIYSVYELSETGRWTYRFRDDLSEESEQTLIGATEDEVVEIERIQVQSVDGTSATMTLRIEGANDAPELTDFVPDRTIVTDDAVDPTATLILSETSFFRDPDFLHANILDFTLNGVPFSGSVELAVGEHILTLRATDPLGEFVEDTFVVTVEQGTDDPL